MQVALYARRSGEAEDDKATIETQVEVMLAWCQRHLHDVRAADIYRDEGVQNETSMSDRPQGSRLLRNAKAGRFNGVVVYDTSRLSRTTHCFFNILGQLDALGVQLFSATELIDRSTPTGNAALHLRTAFTEWDLENFIQKSRHARERLLRDTYLAPDGNEYAYWLGGITPYGYRTVQVNRRRALEVDDRKIPGLDYSPSDVIRWCFEWATADNLSFEKIADRLNARRVPKHGHLGLLMGGGSGMRQKWIGRYTWNAGDVGSIMRNEIYAGHHVYGKPALRNKPRRARKTNLPPFDPVERRVPAIVTPEQWQMARQACIRRDKFALRSVRENHYLLRGKLYCGYCGMLYVGFNCYGSRPRQEGVWYYRCGAKSQEIYRERLHEQGLNRCISQTVTNEIEQVVWKEICCCAAHPTITLEAIRVALANVAEHLLTLQERQEHLQRQLSINQLGQRSARRIFQTTPDDASVPYPLARFQEDMRGYQEEEARLKQESAQVFLTIQETQRLEKQIEATETTLTRMAGDIHNWSYERRRAVVELMVDRVTIYPEENGRCDRQIEIELVFQPSAVARRSSGVTSCSARR